MTSQASNYHGYRFPPEIISHAVWLYHRFCPSFRDAEDLLAQRGQGRAPRRLITDKLGSYAAAQRRIMPAVVHSTQQYGNNLAKASHQPTRQRE